ncbi:MAG: hypothetical protein QXT27_02100 [Pyrobaculum sp.]
MYNTEIAHKCERFAASIAPLLFATNRIQIGDFYSDVYYALRILHARRDVLTMTDDIVVKAYIDGLSETIDKLIDEIPDDTETFKDCVNRALQVLYSRSTIVHDIAERLKSYLTT